MSFGEAWAATSFRLKAGYVAALSAFLLLCLTPFQGGERPERDTGRIEIHPNVPGDRRSRPAAAPFQWPA